MGQFVGCIDGMNEACRAFNYPVVSGNVSLYNETNGVAIPPTPAVGGVGVIPDIGLLKNLQGAEDGDTLILIGHTTGWLGSSIYLRAVEDREDGAPPPVDLQAEKANGDYVRKLIRNRRVNGVHDLSDGGLAVAAAEMAFASKIGLSLKNPTDLPAHAWYFGEDQGRYLISTDENSINPILTTAEGLGVPAMVVGKVGGARLTAQDAFDVTVDGLRARWDQWLPTLMSGGTETV
jgi:phosphoribosylformylglycinamidine synthase